MLVGALTGMTYVVVELAKETRVGTDGVLRVGTTDQLALLANPHMSSGSIGALSLSPWTFARGPVVLTPRPVVLTLRHTCS